MPTLNSLFLALAVILNINKWFYFNLRVRTNVRIKVFEEKHLQLVSPDQSQRGSVREQDAYIFGAIHFEDKPGPGSPPGPTNKFGQ